MPRKRKEAVSEFHVPMPRIGPVIVERDLELSMKGRKKKKVSVRFGKPLLVPGYDFGCVYEIDGLETKPITRRIFGVDGVQALDLAMKMAMVDLLCSKAYQEGRLTWLGSGDLGLPVMDEFRDLIRNGPKPRRSNGGLRKKSARNDRA